MAKKNLKRSIVFAYGIELALTPPAEGTAQPNPRWIHVANEGNYLGYPGGGAEISRKVFDDIIKNFRSDPQYKPGAENVGEAAVVPFDYAHVSEMDPRIGNPATNTIAPAWILDVKSVLGTDNVMQLWAFTKLGDDVKTKIEKGEIKFVSIAFNPKAVDPISGVGVGAKMTSVAFTNNPFIRDLTPLAASTHFYEQANSPEDAIGCMLQLLQMPVSTTPAQMLTELKKVVDWASAGNAPIGVDVDHLLEQWKILLGMPVTATADELYAATGKLVDSLLASTQNPALSAGHGDEEMDPKEFAKRLAKLFGLNAAAEGFSEEVITQAEQSVTMSKGLRDLLTAAGFSNVADLLKQVPDMLKAKSKLGEYMTQLDKSLAALSGLGGDEGALPAAPDAAAAAAMSVGGISELIDGRFKRLFTVVALVENQKLEGEVAAVIKTHAMPEAARSTLLFHLRHDPKDFRAKYPLPDETRASLLTTFAAGPGGAQFTPPATPAGGAGQPATISRTASSVQLTAGQIDLRMMTGRNKAEKIDAYLASKDSEHAKKDIETRMTAVAAFRDANGDENLVFADAN